MKPQVSFISREEQGQIHKSALGVLENMGMQLPSPIAIDVMQKAGAKIEDNNIVKIPEELIVRAVETVPKREGFVLYGREEKHDVHLGADYPPALSSMQEATHVNDLESGERRPGTDKDLADMCRLMDALENVSCVGSLITPQDVPKEIAEWYALATQIKNTSKNIFAAAMGVGYVKDSIKMGALAAGGEDKFLERPFIHYAVLTRPPMQIDRLTLEALIELSRYKLPALITMGNISGVTAPGTLVGAVVQAHAEFLACLTLSQLIGPGTPTFYGCTTRSMNMRYATVDMPSPESTVMRGAQGQMAHFLGVPQWAHGMLRNTKILDAQAGFESGMTGVIMALAGDVFSGLQFDMDDLADFADMVFCDEAMAAIKRVARDLSVDENTLAVDAIKEVGHGGNYLGAKHTLKNYRQEFWVPRLFEHRNWKAWAQDGRKNIEQKAREKAKEIIANHQPKRLAPEVEAEIDRIAHEATIDYTRSI